ncbi:MAG: hypothetical protein QNJ90_08780 [Planctomycetota bacterium]|nr:hypothetical protein [Planctomycetota bacterium]
MTARRFWFGAIVCTAIAAVVMGTMWDVAPAWARGGAAAGGGARPALPGRGAGGSSLLDERRERTKRLRELRGPSTSAPVAPEVTPRRRPQPAPTRDTSLVHLHHGSVRMVADLARVDLTLEVQNVGAQVLEWQRTYAVDPAAELIGAVLKRTNEEPIHARTLTTVDAGRVYARIRTPPPSRTPRNRNRDPLLLTRERNDELHVRIWPINPQETVRVELTFVTPLRGDGPHRTYVDVMGGPAREETPNPRRARPEPANGAPAMVDGEAKWLLQPGELVLSTAPAEGMELRGSAGGRLHFAGAPATRADEPAPRVPFLSKRRSPRAVLVGSGSYAGRIATWRFDPRTYLAGKGYAVYGALTVHLLPGKGSSERIAPNRFGAHDEARPVTARVSSRAARDLRYRVEVRDEAGRVITRSEEAMPLVRMDLDAELEGAISGWHRAQLVRRVFRWAHTNAGRQAEAQRFAVDMGVLVPGSAAIAIPNGEKRRLTRELRRLYETDGVPLGAQRREADLKQVPRGALR